MPPTKLTKEEQKQIISRYTDGELAAPLAREFGVKPMVVTTLLNKHGVEKHTHQYASFKCIEGTVNEHVFDILTNESAYWAGFLMIEGYIYNGYVYLELEDTAVVENFRKFMKGTGKIDGNIYDFASHKVIQRLAELGVTELKAIEASPHPDLAFNPHFWTGVLDANQTWDTVSAPAGLTTALTAFAESINTVAPITAEGLVYTVPLTRALEELVCIQ